MKSKLKNALLIGLSMVLVAVIAIGGTVAYLTDTDSDVNVMTIGNVSIAQHEYERVRDENGNPVLGVLDEDFTSDYGITESYKLQPFTQNKPALPAVYSNGTTAWDEFQQLWNQVGAPGSNDLFDDSMKNVVDKFVFVENTGKTDAYFRTIIAVESPEGLPANYIHLNLNANSRYNGVTQSPDFDDSTADTGTKSYLVGYITVDGVRYGLYDMTHNEILKPGEVARPSLMQVYLDPAATNEDCALFGETWDILVVSQAVQADGFASADAALDAAFGNITTTTHPWTDATQDDVSNDADLEDTLQNPDASTIMVNLTDDVTYDVAAWAAEGMGGENTRLIVINGNGHTVTFNQTNSDWNNIVTNGAKLVINNAHITNAGNNNGPWNRHDLNFACEVELNNVTSDKALAFKSNATLNNVVINDANTSDTYAIWIQPNGQTVSLNGCTIDMLACSDGRGIKIDEQYVDAPAKVTLKVSNTVFKTEEKSAILVKSKAGADVILNNVDISAVAADSANVVWVDEASAAYADLVVVTGGNKVVEGA